MHIRPRDFDAIARLWRELSEFPAAQCDQALVHCLDRLQRIVGASNASWVAATRSAHVHPQDPMRGWWPSDVFVLHDAEANARQNDAVMEQLEHQVIDPQSAAMIARAGEQRAQLRRTLVDDATWERSWLYQDILRPLGLGDRLVASYPVSPTAESYFALDRARSDRPFDDRARDLLLLFLAGCPAFHREQLRVRGFLDASRRLSPRERNVLKLLLTDRSEPEIADTLGLAFTTTHQYVMAVYRKFGVQGRAALAARWLRDRPPAR